MQTPPTATRAARWTGPRQRSRGPRGTVGARVGRTVGARVGRTVGARVGRTVGGRLGRTVGGRVAGAVSASLALAVLAGCSDGTDQAAPPAPPSPAATATSPAPTAAATGAGAVPAVSVGDTLATGLDVPWGVAFLPDGAALVAERPTGRIVLVDGDGGAPTPVGTVPGVADRGEGGLLGLAIPTVGETGAPSSAVVFAYFTSTAGDNRVVSMPFDGKALGKPTVVLEGIPAAGNHNGGLLTFGPDGQLWIGTGEAGRPPLAQDRSSLGGKILRVAPDGSVPADNPFPGSPVYSLGHRNVQGLAFDSADQPWAVEFGQNTWDELNRIEAGGNYGWPEVEGKEEREGFVEPLVQWGTQEASPSGMAIVDDVAYVAGLGGERLWQVPLEGERVGTPRDHLRGEFGRIRNVVAAPGPVGGIWMTTSNRDGRGSPGPQDDRIVRLELGG